MSISKEVAQSLVEYTAKVCGTSYEEVRAYANEVVKIEMEKGYSMNLSLYGALCKYAVLRLPIVNNLTGKPDNTAYNALFQHLYAELDINTEFKEYFRFRQDAVAGLISEKT